MAKENYRLLIQYFVRQVALQAMIRPAGQPKRKRAPPPALPVAPRSEEETEAEEKAKAASEAEEEKALVDMRGILRTV